MRITQFDRLQFDVELLCEKLGRPVSSKDLLRHYKKFPDSRPFLFQRLGQLLIKMSRPRSRSPERINRIGLIGNLMFYAPDDTRKWIVAFEGYSTCVFLAAQVRFRLPDYAIRLIGTRFEGMARNALAGFIEEWSPDLSLALQCGGTGRTQIIAEMQELLDVARQDAAPKFIRQAPSLWISRNDAASILRSEYEKRSPGSQSSTMNVNRHLVHLSWPQSRLFPSLPNLFWGDQVKAYCASRWPITSAEHELGRGLSLIMIYGAIEA